MSKGTPQATPFMTEEIRGAWKSRNVEARSPPGSQGGGRPLISHAMHILYVVLVFFLFLSSSRFSIHLPFSINSNSSCTLYAVMVQSLSCASHETRLRLSGGRRPVPSRPVSSRRWPLARRPWSRWLPLERPLPPRPEARHPFRRSPPSSLLASARPLTR